jgi:hypothetical protein
MSIASRPTTPLGSAQTVEVEYRRAMAEMTERLLVDAGTAAGMRVLDVGCGREFTHADSGQMHLYLDYARERWTVEGENPPVGLILCAAKDASVCVFRRNRSPIPNGSD